MTIEHEWDGLERCIHCGTTKVFHDGKPQNCVPRWTEPPPRHTSTGQSAGDFACDDADVIHARMVELEADRLAIRNTAAEPDEIAKIVY